MMIVSNIVLATLSNIIFTDFLTDANVGFEQITYALGENHQSLTVCVASSAQLERNVTINVILLSGSAEGKFQNQGRDVKYLSLSYSWGRLHSTNVSASCFHNSGDTMHGYCCS